MSQTGETGFMLDVFVYYQRKPQNRRRARAAENLPSPLTRPKAEPPIFHYTELVEDDVKKEKANRKLEGFDREYETRFPRPRGRIVVVADVW